MSLATTALARSIIPAANYFEAARKEIDNAYISDPRTGSLGPNPDFTPSDALCEAARDFARSLTDAIDSELDTNPHNYSSEETNLWEKLEDAEWWERIVHIMVNASERNASLPPGDGHFEAIMRCLNSEGAA